MKLMQSMSRRKTVALGAGACLAAWLKPAVAEAAGPVVVELFTSQGCNSCPPADAIAAGLRRQEGVTVLTYHIDYWDYLGWKDTLGAKEFSQRQYDYAKSRGDMDVYTPQLIVNGGSHYVGSNKDTVVSAVERARSGRWLAQVDLGEADGEITVSIASAEFSGDAMVWLLPIQSDVQVKIERGENARNTFTYYNVVRRIVPAGMWSGASARFRLPADAVIAPDCNGCVALVQRGKAGPVLGAATWGKVTA
jgi:hypothetical protein